jgi:hypothetical protein
MTGMEAMLQIKFISDANSGALMQEKNNLFDTEKESQGFFKLLASLDSSSTPT